MDPEQTPRTNARHEVQRTTVFIPISSAERTVPDRFASSHVQLRSHPKPHPIRSPRKSGTFRAPSVSSDSEGEGDNSTSDSSDETSEPEVLPLSVYVSLPQPDRNIRSPSHYSSSSSKRDKSAEETNYITDAIASIRLAISHHDPYEEWSNQTRREAQVRSFGSIIKNLTAPLTRCLANSTDRAITAYWRTKSQIRSCTSSGCRTSHSATPKGEAGNRGAPRCRGYQETSFQTERG